jgi:hypothetical protein
MAKNNEEFLSTVLATTREQLSKAVNLCAELEALLIMEQKKNSQLESMLEKKVSNVVASND